MESQIKLLDTVALTEDLPNGLRRGQVGAVVEVYAPDAFEVEFIDREGYTCALLTLRANQLILLRYEADVIAYV